jgi:hypothetical protein
MNNQFILQQLMNSPQIKNNPMAQNAFQLYQNKDIQGLNEMANNLAKERNIDLNQFTKDIKARFGMN